MRLPRVRFTVRRMMLAVVVVSLTIHPVLTAYRVYTDPRGHWLYHLWERHGLEEYHSVFNSQHPAPFWPRYWRRLLGRSWPGSYFCDEWCRKSWDRVGRVVVTVPTAPSLLTRVTADGFPDPADPAVIAIGEYNRLVRERETRTE